MSYTVKFKEWAVESKRYHEAVFICRTAPEALPKYIGIDEIPPIVPPVLSAE